MISTTLYYQQLIHLYSQDEITVLLKWIIESKGEGKSDEFYLNILSQLKSGKPIQYVLGETIFYGLKFSVNKNTLIPRPETEELVHLIIGENKNQPISILDIGTGSGCIAITLQKKLPLTNVFGFDIDENAITLAKQNAKLNKVNIGFSLADALHLHPKNYPKYDIIVSNPPYVTHTEKATMCSEVLDFEPHLALFVPDENPLIFYDCISDFALTNLSPQGKLYFEINQHLGLATQKMLEHKGFSATLIKDINGNHRIISAQLRG